ncbi:MAG: SGNH/GDSL hydrolase family protein [Piscinibacter sp.]
MWTTRRITLSLAGLVLVLGAAALVVSADRLQGDGEAYVTHRAASARPLAVLGDSDSHSYQDQVSFPAASGKRGGVHRASTLQWTEVLQRLRPQQVDPGEWGVWGVPRVVARAQQWLGLANRAPRKQDYRYNFAISGAGCETLTEGGGRQVQRLLALMDREPRRWRDGIVVIRIGVNSFGMDDGLDQLARDPMAPPVQRELQACLAQVREAVALLHARHDGTRIVLVGIYDNSHWPRYFDRWRSRAELDNIARGLDVFDQALAGMAAADARIAFFDDRAWFARRWGTRDTLGAPAYKSVVLASGFTVNNTIGDDPHHAVIGDGHAGLVWNVLWTQSLIELLDQRFAAGITPLSDAEAAGFVAQTLPAASRQPTLGE